MIKVNIYNFAKQFQKEYNFLYDHDDRVAGMDEAVEAFDKFVILLENLLSIEEI